MFFYLNVHAIYQNLWYCITCLFSKSCASFIMIKKLIKFVQAVVHGYSLKLLLNFFHQLPTHPFKHHCKYRDSMLVNYSWKFSSMDLLTILVWINLMATVEDKWMLLLCVIVHVYNHDRNTSTAGKIINNCVDVD